MKKVLIFTRHTDAIAAIARGISQNILGDEMVTSALADHATPPANFCKYDTFNGKCGPERHYHIQPKLTISGYNTQSVRRKCRKV